MVWYLVCKALSYGFTVFPLPTSLLHRSPSVAIHFKAKFLDIVCEEDSRFQPN